MPFFALRDVISKVFYSLKDSKTPTITSIGSVSLNVGLNFLFSHFWSIKGLALASSISALVHSILLYFLLRMRIGDYGSRDTLISVVKSTIAAIVMYFIVVLLNSFLVETNLSSLLILLISIFLGMIVYCVLSLMLKNKTVLFLKSYVSSRIKLR